MIDSVTVLDDDYSKLRNQLPRGLELTTNSDVVLLLGPNGVGKTAFLRMLATSLEFHRHFEENGTSCYWEYSADGIEQSVGRVVGDLKKTIEIEPGWFVFDQFYRAAFNKICQRRGISYTDQVRSIDNSERKFPGYAMSFSVISQEGRARILKLEDLLKDRTDENVWGFIRPTIVGEGEIFFQHFDLPQDDAVAHEQKTGLRRYVHFKNTDNLFFGKPRPSPGQNLYQQLESLFERSVTQFFEEQKNPKWEREDYSINGKIKKMFSFGEERPYDTVPEDARLCVVMDEPTSFLDVANKYRFLDTVQETAARYRDRIQFFIATNDYALIEGMKDDCVYLNMYEQPTVSSRTFDVRRYVPRLE